MNLLLSVFLLIIFINEAIADIVSIVLIASGAGRVVTADLLSVLEVSVLISEVLTGILDIIGVGSIECPTNFSYFFNSFS